MITWRYGNISNTSNILDWCKIPLLWQSCSKHPETCAAKPIPKCTRHCATSSIVNHVRFITIRSIGSIGDVRNVHVHQQGIRMFQWHGRNRVKHYCPPTPPNNYKCILYGGFLPARHLSIRYEFAFDEKVSYTCLYYHILIYIINYIVYIIYNILDIRYYIYIYIIYMLYII
jgi:hypothetical protein